MNAGQLLDFIYKYQIDRDATIYTQRIEDVYFEEHGWKTKKKPSEWEDIDNEFIKIHYHIIIKIKKAI